MGIEVLQSTIQRQSHNKNYRYLTMWVLTLTLNSNQFYKMTEKNEDSEEFTLPEGVINSISELSREQFLELMSSDHPAAKDFRRYHKKEFEYRNKSYRSLNDFYRDCFL